MPTQLPKRLPLALLRLRPVEVCTIQLSNLRLALGAVLGMPCSELALALGHVPQVAGQPGVVCLRTRQLPIFIKVGVPCCSGGRAQARTQRLDVDVRRDVGRNGLHHAALEQVRWHGRPCRLRLCWLCCCHTLERLPVGLEPALLLALATLPVARIGKILELLLAWRLVSTWLAQDPPLLLQLRIATSLASSTSRTLRLQ